MVNTSEHPLCNPDLSLIAKWKVLNGFQPNNNFLGYMSRLTGACSHRDVMVHRSHGLVLTKVWTQQLGKTEKQLQPTNA